MRKELEERELKELELMNENENREFYVYVHIRLDNNTVFYVGKGTKNRAYNLSRGKGTHHDNICKACGCKVVIIKNNLTESQAFRLESKMIKYYVHTLGYGINIKGYDNYDHALPHLTNMTWGGEGTSGRKLSDESKIKISEKNKGIKRSEDEKRNISEKMKGRKLSEEHKQNLSKSLEGRQFSEEHKQKLSKKVVCINTGEKFNSLKDAAMHYNTEPNNISCCCRGKRNYAGRLNGVLLQWKYAEDYDNESKAV